MVRDTLKLKKQMLANAKFRANRDGLPFNIDISDFDIPELCPVLSLPLKSNKGKQEDNSPTLDRVVCHLGYVSGNVRVISHKANKFKSNASLHELWKVSEYVEEHLQLK